MRGSSASTESCGLNGRGDADAPGVEAREVEQLLGEVAQPHALLEERRPELVELLARRARRRARTCARDSVHDRDRRAELVRGDRDELILELVDPPELLECPLELLVLLGLRDEDARDEPDRREQVQVELVELTSAALSPAGNRGIGPRRAAGSQHARRRHRAPHDERAGRAAGRRRPGRGERPRSRTRSSPRRRSAPAPRRASTGRPRRPAPARRGRGAPWGAGPASSAKVPRRGRSANKARAFRPPRSLHRLQRVGSSSREARPGPSSTVVVRRRPAPVAGARPGRPEDHREHDPEDPDDQQDPADRVDVHARDGFRDRERENRADGRKKDANSETHGTSPFLVPAYVAAEGVLFVTDETQLSGAGPAGSGKRFR